MADNALRLIEDLVKHWTDKKLAIIAVANKLLKQVFGVVKNECLCVGIILKDDYNNTVENKQATI